MASINIEISDGDSAMEGEGLGHEIGRILRDLATKIEAMGRAEIADWPGCKLYDANGVRVGEVSHDFEADDDEDWDEIEDYISRMQREKVVEALESISIQCYDSETTGMLRDQLFANVKDGAISFSDVVAL